MDVSPNCYDFGNRERHVVQLRDEDDSYSFVERIPILILASVLSSSTTDTMLTVDPRGRTNRVMRRSTCKLSSMHCIDTGRAAPLKAEPLE